MCTHMNEGSAWRCRVSVLDPVLDQDTQKQQEVVHVTDKVAVRQDTVYTEYRKGRSPWCLLRTAVTVWCWSSVNRKQSWEDVMMSSHSLSEKGREWSQSSINTVSVGLLNSLFRTFLRITLEEGIQPWFCLVHSSLCIWKTDVMSHQSHFLLPIPITYEWDRLIPVIMFQSLTLWESSTCCFSFLSQTGTLNKMGDGINLMNQTKIINPHLHIMFLCSK